MNKASPNHRLRFTLLFLALLALAVGGSILRQRTVGAQEPKLSSPGQSDNYKGENANISAPDGTGVVTVTSATSCVTGVHANNQKFDWDVVQGGSYTMTISNVTECQGDTITVFVQGSDTGNFCFNATETAPGSGTYVGAFTMPDPACNTYPISYKCGANQPCNNSGTFNAKGQNGEPQVHLSASTFGSLCTSPVLDAVCTSPSPSPTPREVQGCTLSIPPGSDLGCNPLSIPVCDTSLVTATGVVGQVQCQYLDDTPPSTTLCEHSRKIIYTATGADGTTCQATQTFTWKEDTTKPELLNLPAGGDLGCNPLTLPSCDANVTATDGCEANAPTVSCTPADVTGPECARSQTFTYTAQDGCGNKVTKDVTYTWKEDTTKPVLNVPADTTVECDAVPGVGTATANDNCDGAITPHYDGESRTSGSCPNSYTLTRTWTVTDSCGNSDSKAQVITVQDTKAPTLGDPGANGTIECPATPVFTAPTATDNCGTAHVIEDSDVTTPGACPNTYFRTKTWHAVDDCNNASGTKSQTITVVDTTAPTIGNPGADATIYCPSLPVFTPPAATDGCGTAVAVIAGDDVVTNYSCNTKTVKRSWYAVDCSGNRSPNTVSQTITVECNQCGVEATMGFWQNKNGQKLITSADQTALLAYLQGYAPFSDATAPVATYVTNVIKAASASGTSMNSMLKAQMLSTALGVYLGKINGNVHIDLTHINKPIGSATYEDTSTAFGGVNCQTISQLLQYASLQSNAGGGIWYGNTKATQELAKDTFDAINNNVAFACP